MGNALYTIAVVLIMVWLVGYFGYRTGGLFHLLLGLAVVLIILQLIKKT
ncbi:MAG: lmo0937 family membrane protein [Bacteroidota bacterium]